MKQYFIKLPLIATLILTFGLFASTIQDTTLEELKKLPELIKQDINPHLTFAIIKPDAVKAGNSGLIIDTIERNKFKILRLEKIHLTKLQAQKFYAIHKERPFFKDLVEYMTSGPVITLALEKENAIKDWRKLMGATNPSEAEVGTIRKMFGKDKTHNAAHGSDSEKSAQEEIKFFFPDLIP